ncbi:MAG: hypothetical protein ACI9E1_000904 [Cryomorphaceae bacterium]|jgi:hypothetical protein
MNRPDDKILSSWLEGELEGEELRKVDTWAETHVGDLDKEFKCEIGWCALNDELMASISDSQEPPYPEFFNSKIQQAIFEDMQHQAVSEVSSSSWLQKLRLMLAPAAIAALVAFYAGTQMQSEQPANIPELTAEQSSVYVPHNGIVAAVSESNDATEIILSGLAPISDELDIAAGDTSPGRSPMMANTQEEVNPYIFF